MKNSTTPVNTNFYGDNIRWFIGTVIDNNDIDTTVLLTRVKVRAVGIHDSIPEDKLPWASVVLPTTEGGNGTGRGAAIDIGAQVFGVFLDGANSQYPLVLGSIPFRPTAWEEINNAAVYNNIEVNGQYTTSSGTPVDTFNGPGGGRVVPSEPIDPNEASLTTYRYFRNRGYSDAQARGIFGNIYVESANFREDVVTLSRGTDLDGNSYGICQWRGERYEGLLRYARERNQVAGTLLTQLGYVNWELDNLAWTGKSGLLRCTTAAQAAVHFMRKFERPAVDPNGGYSRFGDPVWSNDGVGTIREKYGEVERINYAVNTTFESTPPQRTVS